MVLAAAVKHQDFAYSAAVSSILPLSRPEINSSSNACYVALLVSVDSNEMT